MIVTRGTPIHCNRCDQIFTSDQEINREPFYGQKATRIQEFVECPHCGQKDSHWIYSRDIAPEFIGNFHQQTRQIRKWQRNN